MNMRQMHNDAISGFGLIHFQPSISKHCDHANAAALEIASTHNANQIPNSDRARTSKYM